MLEFDNKDKSFQERELFSTFVHSLKKGDAIIIDSIDILGQNMEEVILNYQLYVE